MSSAEDFAAASRTELGDAQMRRNVGRATRRIRAQRSRAVAEVPEWEELREAGAAIRARALSRLAENLEQLEVAVEGKGGSVHWARDPDEANALVADLVEAEEVGEVLKVKSMTTDEIGLNRALAERGIEALETDLAELIVQLGGDRPSHLLVPAIHRNRAEIRDLFRRHLPGNEDLGDDPHALAEAARRYLRERFLGVEVAISGANFAVAETGTVAVVESEGNGRMCTTLPRTLITVMGIEKVVGTVEELGTMMRLLPRSATGEAMNPYTSLWSGVSEGDGPTRFHLVLLDAGRSKTLADPVGRDALRCIRCSACVNVCPVYEQVGGHPYDSPYAGPIGAILSPQLKGLQGAKSLPWASTLCGACYEVCPVKIDIPTILVHLRSRIVADGGERGERLAMASLGRVLMRRSRYEAAQRALRMGLWPLSRGGRVERRLPGPLAGWTLSRDLPVPPASFRSWWRSRGAGG